MLGLSCLVDNFLATPRQCSRRPNQSMAITFYEKFSSTSFYCFTTSPHERDISGSCEGAKNTPRNWNCKHTQNCFIFDSLSQCFQYNFQIFTPPHRSRGVVRLKGVYLSIDIFVCAILQLQQRSVVRKLLRINF